MFEDLADDIGGHASSQSSNATRNFTKSNIHTLTPRNPNQVDQSVRYAHPPLCGMMTITDFISGHQ
jgi:hypothetical protein